MECLRNREYQLREGQLRGSGLPAHATHPSLAERGAEGIHCRACGQVVTSGDQRVSVGDSHRHTFFNPAGVVYELGCFRRAPGCAAVGPPSSEFTWFPGHLWQVTLCRHCHTHLGWFFSQGEEGFFGLILPRLHP